MGGSGTGSNNHNTDISDDTESSVHKKIVETATVPTNSSQKVSTEKAKRNNTHQQPLLPYVQSPETCHKPKETIMAPPPTTTLPAPKPAPIRHILLAKSPPKEATKALQKQAAPPAAALPNAVMNSFAKPSPQQPNDEKPKPREDVVSTQTNTQTSLASILANNKSVSEQEHTAQPASSDLDPVNIVLANCKPPPAASRTLSRASIDARGAILNLSRQVLADNQKGDEVEARAQGTQRRSEQKKSSPTDAVTNTLATNKISAVAATLANLKSIPAPQPAAQTAGNRSASASRATIDARAAILNLSRQVLADSSQQGQEDKPVATPRVETPTATERNVLSSERSVLEAAQQFAHALSSQRRKSEQKTTTPPDSAAGTVNAQAVIRQVLAHDTQESPSMTENQEEQKKEALIEEKVAALQKRSQLTTTQSIQQQHADAARRRENIHREQRDEQRRREQQRQPQPVSSAVLPVRNPPRRPPVDTEAAAILDTEVTAIQRLSQQVRTLSDQTRKADEQAQREKREQQQRKAQMEMLQKTQRENSERQQGREKHKYPFVPATTNSAQAALEAIQNIARGVQIAVAGDPAQAEPGTDSAPVPSAQQMLKEFHKRMQIKRDSERMSKEKAPKKEKDRKKQRQAVPAQEHVSQAFQMAQAQLRKQQKAEAANKRQNQLNADRIKAALAGQKELNATKEKQTRRQALMMDDLDGDELFLKSRAQEIVDETLGRQRRKNAVKGTSLPTRDVGVDHSHSTPKPSPNSNVVVVGASHPTPKPAAKPRSVVDLTLSEKGEMNTSNGNTCKTTSERSGQSKQLSVPNPLVQLPQQRGTQRRVSDWTIDERNRAEASDAGRGDQKTEQVEHNESAKDPVVPDPLSALPKQADNTIKAILAGRRVSLEEQRFKDGYSKVKPCQGCSSDSLSEQQQHQRQRLEFPEGQEDSNEGNSVHYDPETYGDARYSNHQGSGTIGEKTSTTLQVPNSCLSDMGSQMTLVHRLLGDSPVPGDEAPIELGPQMITSICALLRQEVQKKKLNGEKRKHDKSAEEANKRLKAFAQQQSEIVYQQKCQLANYQRQLAALSSKIDEQSNEINSLQNTQSDVICNLLNQLKIGMQVAIRQKKEIIALRQVIREDADVLEERNGAITDLKAKIDLQEETIRKLREDVESDSLREELHEVQESLEEEREESAIFISAYSRAALHALKVKSQEF